MVSIIFDVSIRAADRVDVYAAKLQATNTTADDTSGERGRFGHSVVPEPVLAFAYTLFLIRI